MILRYWPRTIRADLGSTCTHSLYLAGVWDTSKCVLAMHTPVTPNLFQRHLHSPQQAFSSANNEAQVLAKEGELKIRDFAYDDDDAHHVGVGTVLPNPKSAPTFPTYVALYEFTAESDNELSVSAGEYVHVLREVDGGWVFVQRIIDRAVHGLVPKAYLEKL